MAPFEEHPVTNEFEVRIAASLQHFSENFKRIDAQIKPTKIIKIGGAGNKCNNLAIDTVDSYIHPSPGLKFWDLCAPESIVKGMGGWATDFQLKRLTYNIGDDVNLKGLILAKSITMHKTIVERMGNLTSQLYNEVFNKSAKTESAPTQKTVD